MVYGDEYEEPWYECYDEESWNYEPSDGQEGQARAKEDVKEDNSGTREYYGKKGGKG